MNKEAEVVGVEQKKESSANATVPAKGQSNSISDVVKVALIGLVGTAFGSFMQHGTEWFGFFPRGAAQSPDKSSCKIKSLSGTLRSSSAPDIWTFQLNVVDKKFDMRRPDIKGEMTLNDFTFMCDQNSIFFTRIGRAGWNGSWNDRSCLHYGKISGDEVDGSYACKEVADQELTWHAKIIFLDK